MAQSSRSLVSADELAAQLDDPKLRIIDFRWYLDDASKGRREYEAGHIPGAVFVDLEDVTGEAGAGRHPLPSRAQFEAAMRAAGVNNDSRVVVYDGSKASVAPRLWWLLRVFGVSDVAVLDGGIELWGGALQSGSGEVAQGDFTAADPDLSNVLTYDEVRKLGDDAVVLDVRAGERYRGETEPIDPIAGHVPGAKNAFWQETLLDESGRIRSGAELRKNFTDLGVDEGNAVVMCGSGVVACQTLLALERAGLGPVRIYAGGWSDWSNQPDADVATGAE